MDEITKAKFEKALAADSHTLLFAILRTNYGGGHGNPNNLIWQHLHETKHSFRDTAQNVLDAIGGHYATWFDDEDADDMIKTAFELGFIDQAMRVRALLDAARKG